METTNQKHVSTETPVNMTTLMCKEMKNEVIKYDHIGQAQLVDARGVDEPVWMVELRKENITSFLIYETMTHYMYIASILVYNQLLPSDKFYEKKDLKGRVLRRGQIIQDVRHGIVLRWEFF